MTKLNRSETVTIRLDPRLNYMAELAGRCQRRTKSSFIEWAVQQAVRSLGIEGLLEWRPIGTAPLDGTGVLLWEGGACHGRVYIAWYSGETGEWLMDYDEPVANPSHWMPLPDGPRDSDAMLGTKPEGLSPEGVAARAEGIAQPFPGNPSQ